MKLIAPIVLSKLYVNYYHLQDIKIILSLKKTFYRLYVISVEVLYKYQFVIEFSANHLKIRQP